MTLNARHSTWLALLLACGVALTPSARSDDGGDTAALMLEGALQVQLVDGNLAGAIERYRQILAEFGDDRPIAAAALVGLGQCYEQMSDPKARKTYQRVLREYGDQERQVRTARARLANLKVDDPNGGDATEIVVREIWERPQTGASLVDRFPRFVIFNDLAVLRWNSEEDKPETRRLSSAARSAAYPVVSPDQRHVAYLSWSGDLGRNLRQIRGDRAGLRSWAELRIVGVDGTEDHVVYRSPDTPWLRPLVWSPDGDQVLTVLERKDGTSEMAMVAAADGSAHVIKSLRGRTPRSVSFSEDGRSLAYDLPRPRNARRQEFFLVQLPDGGERRPAESRYVMSMSAERSAASNEDQEIVHVLNRLGFGPRPGDIERVKAMGVKAYIEQQLDPERIADPLVDKKLASFSSLKMSAEELLERLGPAAPSGVRRRATIFEKRAMVRRKAGGRGRPVENNTLTPDSSHARQLLLEGRPEDDEIMRARVIRAVYSGRQLLEVMVDFWMNHFNIDHGDHQLTPPL